MDDIDEILYTEMLRICDVFIPDEKEMCDMDIVFTSEHEKKMKTLFRSYTKHGRYEKAYISLIVASVVFVIILVVNIAIPSYARNIPIVGGVFSFIQSELGLDGIENANGVGMAVNSNGISVTVSEIFCDGKYMYVSYVLEGKTIEKMMNKGNYMKNQLNYYGKNTIRDGDSIYMLSELGATGIEGKMIAEDTFAGMEIYDLMGGDFPDEFILDIDWDYIAFMNKKEKEVKGNWSFVIPVTTDRDKTSLYDVSIKKGEHSIDSVTVSPVMITVFSSFPEFYFGTLRYCLVVYSDLFPDTDIAMQGAYGRKEGITRIPRNRAGDYIDIYVFDWEDIEKGGEKYSRDVVEKNAIVSTRVYLE